jgi:pimeloyl-ACP methyl ester carboxylesterase
MGLGAAGSFYDEIAREIAKDTSVVWYDRAGLGGSDPAPTPRTVADLGADLHALLQALERDGQAFGPYVLVGHSLGGLTVRYYQHQFPAEVAALVLIDSAHEDQAERTASLLPPEAPDEHPDLARSRHSLSVAWRDPAQNVEGIDNAANSALMRSCATLGDLPLIVVCRGQPPAFPAGFSPEHVEARERVWREMQRELAQLSSRGELEVAGRSGHLVNRDQPEVVIAGIRRAVAIARKGSLLKGDRNGLQPAASRRPLGRGVRRLWA